MKAPCWNRLDFERYFLRQTCFVWHTRLQTYFHNLYVFIYIYKIMSYLVSKHLRHCIGLKKVLCLHCHWNPHRPRLATTCFNLLQLWFRKWNLTLFSFMLPAIKLKSVSILEKYQMSIIFFGFWQQSLLRWQIKSESVSQLNFKNGNLVARYFIRTTVIHPSGATCAHFSFVCFSVVALK